MAICHTPLPEHYGELQLAKQLNSFQDEKLHLWYSLNFIPDVKDIDVLLWHENVGSFLIEVKAVTLSHILEFGLNICKIKNRKTDKGPHNQAQEATGALQNFLYGTITKPTFFIATACFPDIYRSDWNKHWDNNKIIGEFANRLIFKEDISGDIDTLKDRLSYIWFHPPVRAGAKYKYTHHKDHFEEFKEEIDKCFKSAVPLLSPSEMSKLEILENRVRKQTRDEININKINKIYYYGHPGTGKTFRLLEIAIQYAINKRNVLFICFNKTLAADIRRLLYSSPLLKENNNILNIRDVFQLLVEEASSLQLKLPDEDNYDEWAEIVVEDIRKNKQTLLTYDALIIDESQDMKDWAFDFLSLFINENASIYLASGTGQELYGSESNWLKIFKEKSILKRLNRNFRNTLPILQLAHIFYEAKGDILSIEQVIKKFNNDNSKDRLICERREGHIPVIIYIDDNSLKYEEMNSYFFAQEQEKTFINEYKRIIKKEIDSMTEEEMLIDLLILVPDKESMEYKYSTEALIELEVPFTDYVFELTRRTVARADRVRLCTYHSARGLEGLRVIIFGLERFEKYCEAVKSESSKLGYIILSRAVFDNTIAFRAQSKSEMKLFVQSAIKSLNNAK